MFYYLSKTSMFTSVSLLLIVQFINKMKGASLINLFYTATVCTFWSKNQLRALRKLYILLINGTSLSLSLSLSPPPPLPLSRSRSHSCSCSRSLSSTHSSTYSLMMLQVMYTMRKTKTTVMTSMRMKRMAMEMQELPAVMEVLAVKETIVRMKRVAEVVVGVKMKVSKDSCRLKSWYNHA